MKETLTLTFLFCLGCLFLNVRAAAADNPETAGGPHRAVKSSTDVFDGLPALEPGRDFHVSDPEMERLLRVLLRENPDILAARRTWLSSLERPAQNRSLPDPKVTIGYFVNSIETRVGPQKYGLSLTQSVPWLSKLSTDGRRSELVASSVEQGVRQIERDRIREFKRVYFDHIYVQEALRINDQEKRLLHRFEEIALTRYSAGEGIQQNVIKVQTEITRLTDQATSLRERRAVLERRLARLLGRPEEQLSLPEVTLSVPELQYDVEDLEARARKGRPALGALRESIRAGELFVERRRLDYRPDFSFGVAYTNVGTREDAAGQIAPPPDNGDDALAILAQVTIPLYSRRITSGITEARELLNADIQRLDREQDQVRFDVEETCVRLASLLDRTSLYRNNLIPQAEQSLSSSESAYQTNQLGFLDLLDAERVWFQVRLTHRRLLSDLWIAIVDMEWAIGDRFPA